MPGLGKTHCLVGHRSSAVFCRYDTVIIGQAFHFAMNTEASCQCLTRTKLPSQTSSWFNSTGIVQCNALGMYTAYKRQVLQRSVFPTDKPLIMPGVTFHILLSHILACFFIQ